MVEELLHYFCCFECNGSSAIGCVKGCSKHVSSVVTAAKYCSLTPCRFHPFSKHRKKRFETGAEGLPSLSAQAQSQWTSAIRNQGFSNKRKESAPFFVQGKTGQNCTLQLAKFPIFSPPPPQREDLKSRFTKHGLRIFGFTKGPIL